MKNEEEVRAIVRKVLDEEHLLGFVKIFEKEHNLFRGSHDKLALSENLSVPEKVIERIIYNSLTSSWIDAKKYNSFSAAISDIGSSKKTLLISTKLTVSESKTVPSNISLKFLQGGSLNVSLGITVTINGWVEAGAYLIFEGEGSVVLGPLAAAAMFPEWYSG
jgi:hypothetical protein